MPTPVPALVGALTNELIAVVTASHLVGWLSVFGGFSHALSAAGQFIGPRFIEHDEDIDGNGLGIFSWAAQAASRRSHRPCWCRCCPPWSTRAPRRSLHR